MTVSPAPDGLRMIEDRLADPAVTRALADLLDHADLAAVLLDGLDQLLARGEVISESVQTAVVELREAAQDSDVLAEVDVPRIVGTTSRLVRSDLLQPAALDAISLLARGLVRGNDDFARSPVPITGLRSLSRALKDPEVRRSLSYFATVARAFGRELAAD